MFKAALATIAVVSVCVHFAAPQSAFAPAKVASPSAVKQVQNLVSVGVFERVQLGKTPVAYVTPSFHRADFSAKQRFAGYLWQATGEEIVLLYDSRTGKSAGYVSSIGLRLN